MTQSLAEGTSDGEQSETRVECREDLPDGETA
ncbi:hypothetical protein E2C01_090638 [Portunus trituberculatus]|uniref:Uncharacterized protein n=1 Tax=Portunus trituberculatus TaxID=210409 RepID=A0A5B7JQM6_PORTR|nr:hypothetical protein [Portunus trituberculatus]